MNRIPFLSAALLGLCLILDPAAAHADIVLSAPAGLNPGDQFRIVFVTNEVHDATSSDIATYDAFVQAQAAGATYNGQLVHWQAIGSTATVNAIDHIGAYNVPVYRVDGNQVAASTTTAAQGLWSGSIMNPILQGIDGTVSGSVFLTWTGTSTAGIASRALGAGENPSLGSRFYDVGAWVDSNTLSTKNVGWGIYGISEVLVVPSAVPEPSSVVLMGLGVPAVLACVVARLRR